MKIPLENRLKKRAQRDLALFQDVLIRVIYEADSTAEIHGGTAIWRCFGGRRFSKDIDIYLSSQKRWADLKSKIITTAARYSVQVPKLKDTGNLMFIDLVLNGVFSEIDINYKKYYKNPVIMQYENLDGTFYDVLTVPPEVLIEEKIAAYSDRKSMTDLYDMSIIMDHVDTGKINTKLKKFISTMEPPDDLKKEEARLGGLVYEGPIPTFKSILGRIRGKIQ